MSVHPALYVHSHLLRVKPVSSCLSLEDMGHFLQGFHIHPAETGIKGTLLLTCLLAGGPWLHKGDSVLAQARRHISRWLCREARPLVNPVRAMLPVVQMGKLSPRAKKKGGGFPQGTQLGLSPDVHCNPVSSLSRFLGRHGRSGWGCSTPESGSQVQEKPTGQLSFVIPKQETPSSCFLKVQMELGEKPERTHCP